MGTSLFFAIPTGTKDVERRPYPTNTHTYILFSFSFHGRLRYPFVILIPLFFCLFLSSFGYKPASRRKQLSTLILSLNPNPKMIKYSFYKVSTMFSHRNGTMERDFLPRAKTWKTVRRTRKKDAAHAHKRVTAPLTHQDVQWWNTFVRMRKVMATPPCWNKWIYMKWNLWTFFVSTLLLSSFLSSKQYFKCILAGAFINPENRPEHRLHHLVPCFYPSTFSRENMW